VLARLVRGHGFATAVNATAALAAHPSRALLEPLLSDENPYVRGNAALGMAALGGVDGSREILLRRVAEEGHPYARAALARALGRLGGQATLLADLAARDPAPEVRRAAAEAAEPAPQADKETFIRLIVESDTDGAARHVPYVLALPRGFLKAGFTDFRGEVREEQVAPGQGDIDWIRPAQQVKMTAPPRPPRR
jgi:hypothetical protein